MTTLKPEQIGAYAKGAGFSGETLKVMVAIAQAESGGNTNAHNSTPPDDSYGLWQINMLGSLGPARRKTFGITDNKQLFDPATNAKAAYSIYKGSGFNAWTTYTRGAYKRYMPDTALWKAIQAVSPIAAVADATGVVNDPVATTDDKFDALGKNITNSVNAFGKTFFDATSNVVGVAVAVVCVILGIVLLSRKAVTSVIPAGKVAKIASKVVS